MLLWLLSLSDRVVRKLGEGTFGKVVEATDRITKKSYAVKIIRAVQKYRDASKIEIRVLNELKKGDPNNEKSVEPSSSRLAPPPSSFLTDAT